MTRLLISGYYGFNNIGDESILKAVITNLRKAFGNIEITVLSQDPPSTMNKYKVNAVDRKSFFKVVSAVKNCDLLISGGGSLLQDVTSKRSILYYLAIMWIARFFRKDFFIYSQGIGPISSKRNRKLTGQILKRAAGIVVRDQGSKDLLLEIGLAEEAVVIATDPVMGISPVAPDRGQDILKKEGIVKLEGKSMVGFAIKDRQADSDFVRKIEESIRELVMRENVQAVLIPFHYQEDMAVIEELENRLGDLVFTIKHKYLTDEMLSIIGNMDLLVGVRLHSLIHATIMGVKMIGISYDPKINAFLNSIGLKALSATIDFQKEYFLDEFKKVMAEDYQEIQEMVKNKAEDLIESLAINEKLIGQVLEKKRRVKK